MLTKAASSSHQHSHTMANEDDYDASDLGMSMCCIREKEQNKKRNEIMTKLKSVDRVSAAVDLRFNARDYGINSINAKGCKKAGRCCVHNHNHSHDNSKNDNSSHLECCSHGHLDDDDLDIPKPKSKLRDLYSSDESEEEDSIKGMKSKQIMKMKEDKRSEKEDEDNSDSDSDNWKSTKCGMKGCNRTYPHQHVKSLHKSEID